MQENNSIPSTVAEIYNELQSEVTWLHGRWICYRQLFAHSPKRIELLNESASAFFYIIQEVLLDEVQVSLSKLTDPATSGKHENLSLEQLQKRIEASADKALAEICRALLNKLHTQCEHFRTRRHKKLAHIDLDVALSVQTLPEVSRHMIEDALLTLRNYLNAIELHFNDTEWGYEDFIMSSDGEALIATLKVGLRYEELVQARKVSLDDCRKGEWHDA